MAPVLKTGEVKASVGSNPTLSVSSKRTTKAPGGLAGAIVSFRNS